MQCSRLTVLFSSLIKAFSPKITHKYIGNSVHSIFYKETLVCSSYFFEMAKSCDSTVLDQPVESKDNLREEGEEEYDPREEVEVKEEEEEDPREEVRRKRKKSLRRKRRMKGPNPKFHGQKMIRLLGANYSRSEKTRTATL